MAGSWASAAGAGDLDAGFGTKGEGAWSFGAMPAEVEVVESGFEDLEIGMQVFEMIWGGYGIGWDTVYADRELPNLLPALL